MRAFHFRLHVGGEHTVAEESILLPDCTAARQHARQAIADVLCEELSNGNDHVSIAIYIEGGPGERVERITAMLAVE